MSESLDRARAKRNVLREELALLDLSRENEATLRARREALARALAELDTEIASRPKRALPLLDRVFVASPCDARWEDMQGDARARLCGACDKKVYDLSALSRRDAESLLLAHGESICVTFFRRADGTVLTADCPVGARRRMRKKVLAATATAIAMSLAGVTAALGLRSEPEPPPRCELSYRGARTRPNVAPRENANPVSGPRAVNVSPRIYPRLAGAPRIAHHDE